MSNKVRPFHEVIVERVNALAKMQEWRPAEYEIIEEIGTMTAAIFVPPKERAKVSAAFAALSAKIGGCGSAIRNTRDAAAALERVVTGLAEQDEQDAPKESQLAATTT